MLRRIHPGLRPVLSLPRLPAPLWVVMVEHVCEGYLGEKEGKRGREEGRKGGREEGRDGGEKWGRGGAAGSNGEQLGRRDGKEREK